MIATAFNNVSAANAALTEGTADNSGERDTDDKCQHSGGHENSGGIKLEEWTTGSVMEKTASSLLPT